uniref:BMERB domain-containing protein n=1 Tax=Haemonchus contortus TaxID=6289 RepID=A0A7I5E5Z0_HAECO
MRDARDRLANYTIGSNWLKRILLIELKNLRNTIDESTKRDEDELQKLLIDRDTRNNVIESLEQIQREVEELENSLPIAMPSSSDLIDFQQSKTPKLLSKLYAISDVPVDLLPKKEDLSKE